MKKTLISMLLALLLAALLLCGAGLAEEGAEAVDKTVGEVGEVDLLSPEATGGEAPEFRLGETPPKAENAPETENDAADEENAIVVKIDSIHFPDAVFRQYVSDEFDLNGDGWLTEAERAEADEIYAPDKGIQSLQGVGYFGELTMIYCGRNEIAELDVSNNPKLVNLNINDNKLVEIDVRYNQNLELLDVSGNLLDEVDVSKNAKLRTLYTEHNDIVHLDIEKNPVLQGWVKKEQSLEDGVVSWGDKDVVHMSIDATTMLTAGKKVLYSPPVVEIDEEHFPAEDFRDYVLDKCDTNGDGWLDSGEIDAVTAITLRSADDYYRGVGEKDCPTLKGIEYFTRLQRLICPGCNVEEMDLSDNEALEILDCFANDLTVLDVSANEELERVWCFNNQLTSLDLSENPRLESLSCGNNALEALDVTGNARLEALYCSGNRLEALNVSRNTALEALECADNDIDSLDVSKNRKLKSLDCESNALTALNVAKNTKLTALRCGNNAIRSLNVKKCTALKLLYCEDNALKTLALTANRSLEQLACQNNDLSKLDLGKNTKLTELWCHGNDLKKVDIGKCSKLVKLVRQVKMRDDGDMVYWQKTAHKYVLGISKDTTLYNGKKVLYRGE